MMLVEGKTQLDVGTGAQSSAETYRLCYVSQSSAY